MAWQDYTKYLMPIDVASQMGMVPTPYIFFLQSKTKDDQNHYLFYVGFGHSFDPANQNFRIVKHYWGEFLKVAGKHNSLVMIEGGLRPVAENESDAITKMGEVGLLAFLANQENIPFNSPEPSFDENVNYLLDQFTKDELLLFWTVRQTKQYCQLTEKREFYQYIESTLHYYQEKLDWPEIDFSYEHTKKLFQQHIGGNLEDGMKIKNYFEDLTSPYAQDKITNKISRVDTFIRDSSVVAQIVEKWDEGKNLFVIYGRHHAVVQESALRELLD